MVRASSTVMQASNSGPGRLNPAQRHVIKNRIVDYESSEDDNLTPPPVVPPRRGPRRVTKDKAIDQKVWLNGKADSDSGELHTSKKRRASELEPLTIPVPGATTAKKRKPSAEAALRVSSPEASPHIQSRIRRASQRLILPRNAYGSDDEPRAGRSQDLSSQKSRRPTRRENPPDEQRPHRVKGLSQSSTRVEAASDDESKSLEEDNDNGGSDGLDGRDFGLSDEVEDPEDVYEGFSPAELDDEDMDAEAESPNQTSEDEMPRGIRDHDRHMSGSGDRGHCSPASRLDHQDSEKSSSRPRTSRKHQHEGHLADTSAGKYNTGAVKRKTRRDLAYETEQPRWADDDEVEEPNMGGHATQSPNSDRSEQDEAGREARGRHARPPQRSRREPHAAVRERDAQWPEETHLTYPVGRETFQLTVQRADIKQLLQAANKELQYHLAFVNAFPDVRDKSQFMRQALYDIAKEMKLRAIAQRIRKDTAYVKMLVQVPSNRISIFRNKLLSAVSNLVVSQYGLARRNTRQTKARVDKLLLDQHYIFPGDIEGVLEKDRPYEHPIFVEALSNGYFKASDSVGYKFAGAFKSSHPNEDLSEPELPICMLASIAACVHFALEEWQSGSRKEGKFFASVYVNVYNTHIKILEGIQRHSAFAFHELMAELLNQARNKMSDDVETAADSTLRHIDFANLRSSRR